MLSAVVEKLARTSLLKREYAEFERILEALEAAPRDDEHAHIATLVARIVGDEQWLYLVDEALSSQPLNPVVPRLLKRCPDRMIERLGLLLTAPDGLNSLPAMVRLMHATGEPVLGALETRLYEARRQRVATAIHLLASRGPQTIGERAAEGAGKLGMELAGPCSDGTDEVDESSRGCGDRAGFPRHSGGSACHGRSLHDRSSGHYA